MKRYGTIERSQSGHAREVEFLFFFERRTGGVSFFQGNRLRQSEEVREEQLRVRFLRDLRSHRPHKHPEQVGEGKEIHHREMKQQPWLFFIRHKQGKEARVRSGRHVRLPNARTILSERHRAKIREGLIGRGQGFLRQVIQDRLDTGQRRSRRIHGEGIFRHKVFPAGSFGIRGKGYQ